jgi:hypothetical protein
VAATVLRRAHLHRLLSAFNRFLPFLLFPKGRCELSQRLVVWASVNGIFPWTCCALNSRNGKTKALDSHIYSRVRGNSAAGSAAVTMPLLGYFGLAYGPRTRANETAGSGSMLLPEKVLGLLEASLERSNHSCPKGKLSKPV